MTASLPLFVTTFGAERRHDDHDHHGQGRRLVALERHHAR